jgi:mono/diheme cytochrome c family protein
MRFAPNVGRVAVTIASLGLLVVAGARDKACAETAVQRGAYLVNTIGACGHCHTPTNAAGEEITAQAFAGGLSFDDPGIGHVIMPNITPDKETGIGNWTDAQIVTALRDGTRPDGSIIGPPMPIPMYRNLSDGDAAAIAAYLRSLTPVHHVIARTEHKSPPRGYGPPVTHVDEPNRKDKTAYGGYLATFGHCVLCHTPPGKDTPLDMSRAFAGGRELPAPNGVVISRNITSDPEDGIGNWTDAQIKRAIVDGIRPDSTRLVRRMPFDWYKRMMPEDLDAIVAFLRTIKPVTAQGNLAEGVPQGQR